MISRQTMLAALELDEKKCWYIFLLLSLIRIGITAPLYTCVDTRQIFDDMLFSQQALSLANGDWLGKYTSLTLCKGPTYPFFLSLIHLLKLPYLGTMAAFRCICLGYLLFCCRPYFRNLWAWLLLGLIILFDPIEIAGRLLRNDLYFSLTCVFIGVLLRTFNKAENQPRLFTAIESVFVGLCFGMLWYVREETTLLLISIVVSLAFVFMCRIIFRHKYTLVFIMSGFCGVFVFYLTISLINLYQYDRFVSIETTSNPYKSAFATLLSIEDPVNKPGVMISPEKFKNISPYVQTIADITSCMTEGNIFEGWRRGSPAFSEETLSWTSDPNKSYVSGNFIEWQFRQCVENAGYYKNSATAANFYQTMKDQLDKAIFSNYLRKAPKRFTFGSFFIDFNDWDILLRSLYSGVQRVIFSERVPLVAENSCSEGDLRLIHDHEKAFNLHVCTTEHPEQPSLLAHFSYEIWEDIIKFYNVFPRILYTAAGLLLIPICFNALLKKDLLSLYMIVCCLTFIVSRYIILAIIHVRGFYALFVGYYSAGYVALSVLSFFIIDRTLDILVNSRVTKIRSLAPRPRS